MYPMLIPHNKVWYDHTLLCGINMGYMLILFNRYSALVSWVTKVLCTARGTCGFESWPSPSYILHVIHILVLTSVLASCPPSHRLGQYFGYIFVLFSYFLFGYTHLQVYTFYIGYLSISIQLYMHLIIKIYGHLWGVRYQSSGL